MYTNVGTLCDLVEVLAGQSGVNRSKLPRRLLYDLVNLKGMEAARRTGIINAPASITTVANQATYELAPDILHVKEAHVNDTLAYKITRDEVIKLRQIVGTGTVIDGTTVTWHWYIERRGLYGFIGIVDDHGNAPTTAGISVDIYYSGFPDAIQSDQDTIGIPERYFFEYAKSVAAEVLKMNGATNPALIQSYAQDWERVIYDMRHDQVDLENQPAIQLPVDITCE